MCNIFKTTGHKVKQTTNLGHRSKYLVYVGYFWLLSVYIQFGVIQCISEFRRPWISKRLVVERNGPKFGPQGWVFTVYRVLLFSVQVQFGVIRCISKFWRPCILKTSDRRAKRTKLSTSEVSLLCIQSTYHCWVFHSFGAFPVFDSLVSSLDLNIQGSLYC